MGVKKEKEQLIQYFKDRSSFTTDDLLAFFSQSQKDIKRATVNWRIYELVRQGILNRTGRGVFSIGKEQVFSCKVQKKQKSVSSLIKNKLPLIKFCCWHTSVLKEFYHHIAKNDFLIVDVERDAVDSVFFLLKDTNKNIFKEPSPNIIENYVYARKEAIIAKALLSESPLQSAEGVPVPSLEKILVDLYADSNLFFFLQGNELVNIFRNAFEKYTINRDKLMRYAKRRNKEKIIQSTINQINGNNLI